MTLWLQVDPVGGIWTGPTEGPRKKIAENIGDFTCEKWNKHRVKEGTSQEPFISIHSTKQNADLLIKVYKNLQEMGLHSIALHKPPSRLSPAGVQSCNSVVWADSNYPASLGGPRPFTEVDLLTCRLQLQAACKNDHPDWPELIDLVKLHPAWPAFSFLPFVKPKSAIRLISMLGDPRWYVNPKRADSSQDLIAAFGLAKEGLANMHAALKFQGVDGGSSRSSTSALTVLYSWCPVFLAEGQARLCMKEDIELEHLDKWILSDYLQSSNPVDGLLLASRRFLRAVCNIWLDNLTPPRVYEQRQGCEKSDQILQLTPSSQYSPELFVPNHEFSDKPKELVRWHKHIAEWREQASNSKEELGAHEGTSS